MTEADRCIAKIVLALANDDDAGVDEGVADARRITSQSPERGRQDTTS